ncbi:MAG TPA: FtsQ-type POTRA domain-containing protein [Nocardioides sp.]|nr:FtsQ-type POTRA domain-containing protein [Nocardioides sp.]
MADRSVARTRRRFARRQWARRWLTWRFLLAGFLVLAAIGLGVYGLYFSSWLRVEGTEVVGEERLTEAEILARARVPEGEQLARVDLDALESRISSLTAVDDVQVSRQWPHELRIEVTEKEAVAVFDRRDQLVYLDEHGETFEFAQPLHDVPAGLPLVVGSGDEPALQEAAAVVAALSEDVAALVDHVEVETVDRILLELAEGRIVHWGSADQSEEKAEVILRLLEAAPEATEYDVSVPGRPTTK